ncbi:MAG: glycogen synthase, partial [Microcystaceae cyanobacterium]
PWNGGAIHCSVYCGWVHGRLCFFIEPHSGDNFFHRGHYYGALDDHMRFSFFSKAAIDFIHRSNKRPDIIHCHDWQTGLIPVLQYEIYKYHGMANQRIVYTIHNFKHQGVAGPDVLRATGLNNDGYYYRPDKLQDNHHPGAINFMKAGIVYANYVNTVSPHHAWEARFSEISCGLGQTLEIHQGKFGGILNGIDYEFWNPESDRFIAQEFTVKTFEEKVKNKKALRERLSIRENDKPLVCFIGRLDEQKGVNLLLHAIYYSLENGCQFVLLGSATAPDINTKFWHEKQFLSSNPDAHLELGFNEELSHLIYAGADMIVVPSNYEPCGLTQMIGLRYGTVPVVRGVGGLVNTVFDRDYDQEHSLEERNGFVFYQEDQTALESALSRAIALYKNDPQAFRELAIQGMKCDYSWKNPGEQYVSVYDYIRHK